MRVLAAVAVVGIVASACAGRSTSLPGNGAIHYPTGPNDVLLRISLDGGFIGPQILFERIPEFTLTGDGSLIVAGVETAIYPGAALPAIVLRRVSEEGVQAILRAAIAAGLDDDGSYMTMGVSDMPTTTFTLTVNGHTYQTRVYALDAMGGERPARMRPAEWEARRRLTAFLTQLGRLDQWLPAGSLGAERPFESSAAHLLVGPYQPDGQLPQPASAWPLAGSLTTFGDTYPMGGDLRCGTVSGGDWTALRALAGQANELTPWTDGGARFSIVFRPLIPGDPKGC